MRRNKSTPWLLLAPFILVTAIVLLAIINIIMQSLGYIPGFGMQEISLKYYKEIFGRADVMQSLLVSIRIALISSLVAAILGTILCAALVKSHKDHGLSLYTIRLPILVPHAVVAVFTVALLSQTGLFARLAYAMGLIGDYTKFPTLLYGTGYVGVIIAYLWKEIPFIAYFALALMSSISETLGEAAENLGASPIKSFLHVTLPMSMPAIVRGFVIVLVFSFGGYELPLLLGATMPKAFPVYTYIEYIKPDLHNRPYAMAMNGITLLISAVVAIAYAIAMNKMTKKLGGNYEK